MTRDEMIKLVTENPYIKVRHEYFSKDEYIYSKPDGKVYAEDGCLFEDWMSEHHDGIRMRSGNNWENGWSIFEAGSRC